MRNEVEEARGASESWLKRSPAAKFGQFGFVSFLLPALSLAPAMGFPSGEPAILTASTRVPAQGELLREFKDPCLGTHWQLRSDPMHPEGPRRLILLDPSGTRSREPQNHAVSSQLKPSEAGQELLEGGDDVPNLAPPLAIRTGDRVTVDQQTPLLHARLQAVALESAGVGQRVRVRLGAGAISQSSLSATVIAVLVTGAGQAKW